MAHGNFSVDIRKLKNARIDMAESLGYTKKSSSIMDAVDRSGIEGGQFDMCYAAIEALKARLKQHCVEITALHDALQSIIGIYSDEEMELVNSSNSEMGYLQKNSQYPFSGPGGESGVMVDGGLIVLDYDDIRVVRDSLDISFDL